MGKISDHFDSAYRDYAINGIPSSGLYEPIKSDLRSLGGTIEESLGDEMAPYIAEAAGSAVSANIAAAIQNTLTTAPSALPYEVTGISGGIGTGSGGTPGWYVGGVSGGPANYQWSYQIGSDGKLAATRIDNPGLATSNTAPTLSLPSGGMTGATVPTATVGTIPVNRIFFAPSTDGTMLLAWGNNAGALATAPFGAIQQGVPAGQTSTGGALPPVVGNATTGSGFCIVDSTPLGLSGVLSQLQVFTTGESFVTPFVCSLNGDGTLAVVAVGVPTKCYAAAAVSFPTFTPSVLSTHYVGFWTPDNVLSINNAATGFAYWQAAGTFLTTGTASTSKTVVNNQRLKLGWAVNSGWAGQAAANANQAAKSAFALGTSTSSTGIIPAVDGSATYGSGGLSVIRRDPAPYSGTVTAASAYFSTGGTGFFFVAAREAGSLVIKAMETATRAFSSGANDVTGLNLPIAAGQFVGVYTTGSVRNSSGGAGVTYFVGAPSAVAATYTPLSTTGTPQLGFKITGAVAAEAGRAATVEASLQDQITGSSRIGGSTTVGTSTVNAGYTLFPDEAIAYNGILTQLTVQAALADSAAYLVIATKNASNQYTLVSQTAITLASGANTISGLNLQVSAGQYVGVYASTAALKYNSSGGVGAHYMSGLPGTNTASSAGASWLPSIGWTILTGVSNLIAAEQTRGLAAEAALQDQITGSTGNYGANAQGATQVGVGNLTVFSSTPIAKTGRLNALSLYSSVADGTARIVIATKSGSTYTAVASYPLALELGANSFSGLKIDVTAGQYIGVYGTQRVSNYDTTTGAGIFYFTGYSFSASAPLGSQASCRLSLAYAIQSGVVPRVATLETAVTALQSGTAAATLIYKPFETLVYNQTAAQVRAVGWDGQSNSISFYQGSTPSAVITGTQLFNNVMDGGSGAFTALVSVSTEKSWVTSANYATALQIQQNALDPASQWLATYTAGVGGASIDPAQSLTIGVGSASATNFVSYASTLKSEATAAGKTFAFAAMNFVQGESDIATGMAQATYKAHLENLRASLQTGIQGVTGNSDQLLVVMMQPSANLGAAGAGAGPVLAQLELAQTNDRYFLCGAPMYRFPTSSYDNIHLTNVGYKLQGAYFGKANAAILQGKRPQWINPKSAVYMGSTISILFDVPVRPLVLDTTTLGMATNYGFKVLDNGASATISSVVAADDRVIITLSSPLSGSGPVLVRYALDYVGAGINIVNGRSGNLRDSDPLMILIGNTLHFLTNWAPHFQLTVTNVGV